MKELTDQQKKLLWLRMNRSDGQGWEAHAVWATKQFGKTVTAEECSDLYLKKLLG